MKQHKECQEIEEGSEKQSQERVFTRITHNVKARLHW